MDKLIHDGRSVTISNDGATLIGLLDIVHPAARTLVDIAQSQDNEVGDGTTSVVLMAGELMKQSKSLIEEGILLIKYLIMCMIQSTHYCPWVDIFL